MSRIIWKGAISFGLVHVPVVLKPAARANDLDFDWLDKRDMAPVGYSRINKRTGKPIESENIVKGYQYEKGSYVLLNEEDFRRANVAATQTVEILSFVDADTIPPYFFETPYFLEPDRRGDKGYALLRETLRRSGRAALASVVIHSKQHLAAVLVLDQVMVLNTMRFADEVLSTEDLKLPGKDLEEVGVGKRELDMAQRLVEDMTEDWKPERYTDSYRDDLLARIDEKINADQTKLLTPVDGSPAAPAGAQIIDLVAMLKKSLDERGNAGSKSRSTPSASNEKPINSSVSKSRPDKSTSASKPATKSSAKTATKTSAKSAATSRITTVKKSAVSATNRKRA